MKSTLTHFIYCDSRLRAWIFTEVLSRAADPCQMGKEGFLFLSSFSVAREDSQVHHALPHRLPPAPQSQAAELFVCPRQAHHHQIWVGKVGRVKILGKNSTLCILKETF